MVVCLEQGALMHFFQFMIGLFMVFTIFHFTKGTMYYSTRLAASFLGPPG